MRDKLLIGCDIGTSGTKTVAMDVGGNILAHASCSYGIITLKNQWAEQWPDVWLNAALKTITEVAAQVTPECIAGICISALYGGTGVLCNDKMQPVRPTIIWMDRRAEEESKWISNQIGKNVIFDVSKNGIDSYYGYTKLLWVQQNEPDLWKKIRMILPIHSYIVYKLTGKLSVDYCSAGNVGGIYDYEKHGWSDLMLGKLNIGADILPKQFFTPSDIVGGLNAEFSKQMGLLEGIPVCAGTVDCIAAMLSTAAVKEGDNAAILGTSLNWGFIHSRMPSNPNLISMPYCIEPTRLSYTYGGASTAGALPRWFLNNFLQNESADTYSQIEKEIIDQGIPAGSDGLIVLPYFMGERTPIWDVNASGMILGLSLRHTKAHIFKAILESTAYSLKHIIDTMTEGVDVERIVLVGGGAKSDLWKSIFADVTGLPVYSPQKAIEAPLGDAFLAGIGTGLLKDFCEIKNWIGFNAPVEPNIGNYEKYQRYFEVYKDLYPKLKNDMRALKELSLSY